MFFTDNEFIHRYFGTILIFELYTFNRYIRPYLPVLHLIIPLDPLQYLILRVNPHRQIIHLILSFKRMLTFHLRQFHFSFHPCTELFNWLIRLVHAILVSIYLKLSHSRVYFNGRSTGININIYPWTEEIFFRLSLLIVNSAVAKLKRDVFI